MFSVAFFPLHIRGKEKSTIGGEASAKNPVVIRGSPKVKDPGSLGGNPREGDGYLGTWLSSCILAWNPLQLYQAALWECKQMEWGLYHCGLSLQPGKHRAGAASLGLSMPVARVCESILPLPRASILSVPSLLQMVSLLKTTTRFQITKQACTSLEYKLIWPITSDKL